MKIKFLTIFGITILISACQSSSNVMSSWIGRSETELYKWGAPNRSVNMGDKKVYTWERKNLYGRNLCEETFIISKGIVEDFSTTCGLQFSP